MSFTLEIPKELAHLKKDGRGYPIPFFVHEVNCEPEFRFLSYERQKMILDCRLCGICGKPLSDDDTYFIGGPLTLQNFLSTDAGMHKVCAEFSLKACPHMFHRKAQRRDNDLAGMLVKMQESPIHVAAKPPFYLLIKASRWQKVWIGKELLSRFVIHSVERYIYIDNKLTKEQ